MLRARSEERRVGKSVDPGGRLSLEHKKDVKGGAAKTERTVRGARLGPADPRRARGSLCFFFSSRRRHTRFDCDWSSDVCSSDLHRAEVDELAGLVDELRGRNGIEPGQLGPGLAGKKNQKGDATREIGRASCREKCRSRRPPVARTQKRRERRSGEN